MAPRVRTLISDHAGAAQLVVLRSRRAARHYLTTVPPGGRACGGTGCHYGLVAAVPELRGDRIVLNAYAESDVAAHVAGEDEETARRFGWWPARSTGETVRAAYAEWARSWREGGPVRAFAVRDPETGALVGGCELRIQPGGTGEVTYWTHAGHRGRGHATNALGLLAGYAASAGVARLEAHVAVGNRASRRVAESAGFTQAGTFTEDGTEMIRYTREVPPPRGIPDHPSARCPH